MRTTRKTRFTAALVALVSMLFMQLAVAAHACDGISSAQRDSRVMASSASAGAAMPGCEQAGSAKAAQCHAHCQDGKVSSDKPQLPTSYAAVMAVGLTVALFDPHEVAPVAAASQSPLLTRATAPPIFIRHCCFRN
jgi:hypothetical protein